MIYRDYLIIGAGVAAANACQSIREYDKKGSVAMIGYEPTLPYDRTALSKQFLSAKSPDPAELLHVAESWYEKNKIELRMNTLVTQLNLERRLAVLTTGQTIEFKKALLATGSRSLRPQVAGANLGNIIYLRSLRDACALRETVAEADRLVVIGGGFIGLEAAAALAKAKRKVTLMTREPQVWQHMIDPRSAKWLTGYVESLGVDLMLQEALNGFEGKTVLKNIQTKSGKRFAASAALLSVGGEPNLQLVANTPLSSPNGTPVSETLETEEKGIFAAGDIALYPDRIFGGVRRVDHWENAAEQGTVAGANMTGKKRQRYIAVPHYWSQIADHRFEFFGDFSLPPQQVQFEGDYDAAHFTARYLTGDKLTGVFLCNPKPSDSQAAREKFPKG